MAILPYADVLKNELLDQHSLLPLGTQQERELSNQTRSHLVGQDESKFP